MDRQYHFIGIGGIGMSGIAQLLLACGKKVSGSDLKESKVTRNLEKMGARFFLGHDAKNIENADLVVYSSAVKEDNPEIIAAKKNGIALIRRAEALASLMRDKAVIAVAGSHGKTTTTSLVSYMLIEAGLNPTVAIGGILRNIESNACLGSGDFFVAEADESDGSFLYYQPKYSIVTNIDREHLDYYKDFSCEVRAFGDFLNRTSAEGCVFCSADDKNLAVLFKDYPRRKISFGITEPADIYPKNIRMDGLSCVFDCFVSERFSLTLKRQKAGLIGNFELALGGRHNISNSLSVIALGLELGLGLELIRKALKNYQGSKRRLETKFKNNDYILIDDYAHHPTEIAASLSAVRNLRFKRLIAVFQPHRYSRTRLLLDEFTKCFDQVDVLFITDIYSAGEVPEEGINAELICERIKQRLPQMKVEYLPRAEITGHIQKIIAPGDLVLTLGAGDITKISDELAEKFTA